MIRTRTGLVLSEGKQILFYFKFSDADVYLLNSLYQIHSILSLFKGNDGRLSDLSSEMQLHLDTLSSEQTSNLIGNHLQWGSE